MTNRTMKRPPGRPPKYDNAMEWRINIRGTAEIRAAVEAVRAECKDGSDTAQVIRRLLVEALEARGKL